MMAADAMEGGKERVQALFLRWAESVILNGTLNG
jgi:hypothetical protein